MGVTKPSQVALFFFAAVGAVGSIVTIAEYLSRSEPALEAKAYVNKYTAPETVDLLLGDKPNVDNLADFALVMRTAIKCDIGQANNKDQFRHYCNHLEELGRLGSESQSSLIHEGLMIEVVLENKGRMKAGNIRIEGGGLREVNLIQAGQEPEVISENENGYYPIPDLNPGEISNIYIYKDRFLTYSYDSFGYDNEIPNITYENGFVNPIVYSHQFSSFLDQLRSFNLLEWVLAIGFVVVCSFVVCAINVIPFAIVDALRRGVPLSSVFNSKRANE